MPSVRRPIVTTWYAAVACSALVANGSIRASTSEEPTLKDLPPAVTTFVERVQRALAPTLGTAPHSPIAIRDSSAIRDAALAQHHSEHELRMLRVAGWLGAVPSKLERGTVELPEPIERAARFDPETKEVWLALGPENLAVADEIEAFLAIAFADLRSLSASPTGVEANRCRDAVAQAVAERLCWKALAYSESGAIPASDDRAVFLNRGAALERVKAPSSTPPSEPWFRSQGEFTSIVARAFVDRAIGFSGEGGLAIVLRNPPVSSEQLLYPEKYFDPAQRDEPSRVTPNDLLPKLGTEWTRYLETELGEYGAGVLLRATGDPLRALKAARGFDGDAFRVYEHAPTQSLLLHWTVELDSRSAAATARERSLDAVEFIDSLRKTLERRYAGSNPRIETRLDEDATTLSSIATDSKRAHALARRVADRVEIVICDHPEVALDSLLTIGS